MSSSQDGCCSREEADAETCTFLPRLLLPPPTVFVVVRHVIELTLLSAIVAAAGADKRCVCETTMVDLVRHLAPRLALAMDGVLHAEVIC